MGRLSHAGFRAFYTLSCVLVRMKASELTECFLKECHPRFERKSREWCVYIYIVVAKLTMKNKGVSLIALRGIIVKRTTW